MKDYTKEQLEESRPEIEPLQCVVFCLEQLYKSNKEISNEVVPGLTFEELIGALLVGRDAINNLEEIETKEFEEELNEIHNS